MSPRRNEKGQTLPLVALCVVTLMVAAALGVDIGSLAATNRRLQAVADLAAIDGSRELTGTACNDTYVTPTDVPAVPSSQYDHVVKAVVASADRNGFEVGGNKTLVVDLGFVTRDAQGVPTFNALPSCDATVPDSVRVRAGDRTAFGFGKVVGHDGSNSNRAATSTLVGEGAFTIGSSLVTFDASRSALLNPILSQMLCRLGSPCTFNLTAVGYQGLVDSEIRLGDLATQLGFGTTNELLNANLTIDQILSAAALLADPSTTAGVNAATALGTITAAVTGTGTIKLLDLVSSELANGNDAANAEINLFDLVMTTAAIANGSHAVSIPNTAVSIPGVSSITASISLVEAPVQIAKSPGATGNTAQFDLDIRPVLSLSGQSLPVLNELTSGVLGGVSVTGALPISIEAGRAFGELTRVRCGADKGIDAAVAVEAAKLDASGTLTLSVGTSSNQGLLGGLAGILGSLVLGGRTITTTFSATGTGFSTEVGSTELAFDYPDGFGPDGMQHVGNTTVGLDNLAYGSANATLSIPILGLVPATANITVEPGALVALLAPVTSQIDDRIVQPLMEMLGLDLGAADVTADWMRCGVPALAG